MSSGGDASSGGRDQPPCEPALCRGRLYACGNCLDDDGDGAFDAFDPHCLGPCDDDESALGTGLRQEPGASCRRDCYFDGDNGPGNDQCAWSDACDPLSVPPDYPPSGNRRCEYAPDEQNLDCSGLLAEQSEACLEACLPLVPNGCDCFGCCELPAGSGEYRSLGGLAQDGSSCGAEGAPIESCPRCTPVLGCLNPCEPCEVCVLKPLEATCDYGSACPAGTRACAADAPCDFAQYCVTGCCVDAPEPT
jgi:hypothetical protein